MIGNIMTFFGVWGIIIVLNQFIFYGGCFKSYCISSALPHTFILTLVFFFMARDNAEKEAKEKIEISEEETYKKDSYTKSSKTKKNTYCGNCGTLISQENKFCTQCGTKV